jgi:hypothetical protein
MKPSGKSTRAAKIIDHLWDDKTRKAFHDWLKLIISFRGIWIFAPAVLTIFFVYWAEGYSKPLISKKPNEVLAIVLMSLVVVVFLIRSLLYRLEMDYVLLLMAANFLCREFHFSGTDDAVVFISACVLAWVVYRKDHILANIEDAGLFQVALTGTIFTYFIAILIQRRVFKPTRLPLLPNEEFMHISLEEVLENIAHAYFLFCGIAAFFSIRNNRLKSPQKPGTKIVP